MKATQEGIDETYDAIDYLMTNGKWLFLNHLFHAYTMAAPDIDLDMLLTLATASLPAKTKIPYRGWFLMRCKELHPNPELWKGLE